MANSNRRIGSTAHVTHMNGWKIRWNILFWKPEGMRPFRKLRRALPGSVYPDFQYSIQPQCSTVYAFALSSRRCVPISPLPFALRLSWVTLRGTRNLVLDGLGADNCSGCSRVLGAASQTSRHAGTAKLSVGCFKLSSAYIPVLTSFFLELLTSNRGCLNIYNRVYKFSEVNIGLSLKLKFH
jgi:hypothetical protein